MTTLGYRPNLFNEETKQWDTSSKLLNSTTDRHFLTYQTVHQASEMKAMKETKFTLKCLLSKEDEIHI